ncbi:MAG TPA: thiamine-phosphate kinase [Rhizomicrobium sp.]
MKSPEPRPRPGEFELIAELFAPLARDVPGAFGLTDDVAAFAPRAGHEIVLKTDSLIESVHFLRTDPAATVAQKALRRALSDLAAKGAEPYAYLLALALPRWPDRTWLEEFARGLRADQAEFGVSLIGGETDATPGPVVITAATVGYVPEGMLIRRSGARSGDRVFVSGAIGDAGGGLSLSREEAVHPGGAARDFLVSRYRLPIPRLKLGLALRGLASAAIDVSDGLLADLGHIAETSRVRIEVDAGQMPLSGSLRELWGEGLEARARAAGAGDDYEIAFTAPPSTVEAVLDAGRRTGTPVTAIGRVIPGHGVAFLDATGQEISVLRRGHTHF